MARFTGYHTTVELRADEAIIRRNGLVAVGSVAEVSVPLDALVDVRVKDATPLVNGLLQFVLADAPSPDKPAMSDPYTVVFRRRTRNEIEELRRLLRARIEHNRSVGVDPLRVSVDRVVSRGQAATAKHHALKAERAAGKAERAARSALPNFGGITINQDLIESPYGGGPIAGARATVDTAGQLSSRMTATRLILTGPLALAWRKKTDKRELYFLIEGDGWAVSVPVDASKGPEARAFAAQINGLGSRARASDQPSLAAATPETVDAQRAPAGPLEQIVELRGTTRSGFAE